MTLAHPTLPFGSTIAVLPSGVSLARVAIFLRWSGLSQSSAVAEVTRTSTGRSIVSFLSAVTETFHNLAASIKTGLGTFSDLTLKSRRRALSERPLVHPHS